MRPGCGLRGRCGGWSLHCGSQRSAGHGSLASPSSTWYRYRRVARLGCWLVLAACGSPRLCGQILAVVGWSHGGVVRSVWVVTPSWNEPRPQLPVVGVLGIATLVRGWDSYKQVEHISVEMASARGKESGCSTHLCTALTDMFDDYSIRWRVREPDGHIVGYTTHIATAQASVQTGAVCRERTAQGMMHSHRVSALLDFRSGEVELGREDGEREGNLRLILGARSRHAMGYTSCR